RTGVVSHLSEVAKALLAVALLASLIPAAQLEPTGALAQACANPVACENAQPGTNPSQWNLPTPDAGDPSIQGFATDISVNKGGTVHFKINTPAPSISVNVYRIGYYQSNGARLQGAATVTATLPQTQPACLTDPTVGLVDCGNWAETASWNVPATAVSGVYFAKLTRSDTGGASHLFFIVRDDASTSPLLYQTSDTTWQAYNPYGGASLYVDHNTLDNLPRAEKVSYNRPFFTRNNQDGLGQRSFVWTAEYPMIRFLEQNGYDISYMSGIDTERLGVNYIKQHKTFLSVGHDEYWSGGQRSAVEAARDAGINLAFFSGNQMFWKTRWENSIDGSNTAYRTLVSYKETHANARIDPLDPPTWTGTWRDPRFSVVPTSDGRPPADGGRPENGLSGTMFMVNGIENDPMTVSSAFSNLRFWRNTRVATLGAGQSTTITAGCNCILGYEWDVEPDNGFRPAGLFDLSSTTRSVNSLLQDYGS